MSTSAVEVAPIKATIDASGVVWILAADGMPYETRMKAEEFLGTPEVQKCGRWRVPGGAGNADLVVGLQNLMTEGKVRSLELCSPLVCESAEYRKDPRMVLYYMRSFSLPASLGGWRPATPADYIAYGICQMMRDGRPAADMLDMAVEHPVWNAIHFVSGVRPEAAAKLLGTILDPRWYVDQAEPDRSSKLEQYLGLNPGTMKAVGDGRGRSWLQDRCSAVLQSWKGDSPPPAEAGPRDFLWRVWAKKGGGLRGDLCASKYFITYLRHNWLNELQTGHKKGRLFVPEYFFNRPDEVGAYRDYMKLLRRTRQCQT
jgi:hypothetical protein